MTNCAVSSKSKTSDTCITKSNLVDILLELISHTISSNNLDSLRTILNRHTKADLHKGIKSLIGDPNERNWWKYITNPNLIDILTTKTFKLKTNKGVSKKSVWWLSNRDINNIMSQNISTLPINTNCVFIGALPSNYFDIYPDRFTFVKTLIQSNKRIGIVFNTDTFTGKGDHWVSLYIQSSPLHGNGLTIYYFDSNGDPPNKYISSFIHKIRPTKLVVNDHLYQKQDGLCGLYSIHYIMCKFRGNVCRMNDTVISKKRTVYFSKK